MYAVSDDYRSMRSRWRDQNLYSPLTTDSGGLMSPPGPPLPTRAALEARARARYMRPPPYPPNMMTMMGPPMPPCPPPWMSGALLRRSPTPPAPAPAVPAPCDCHSCRIQAAHKHCKCACEEDEVKGKTKDVTIRGVGYKIRKAFLDDNDKFESFVGKYCDKKPKGQLTDRVISLLVEFINTETYANTSLSDEVAVYILATACSVKSLKVFALGRLEEWGEGAGMKETGAEEVVDAIALVCLCGDSDAKIKEWLRGAFTGEGRWLDVQDVWGMGAWEAACHCCPQLVGVFTEVLGLVRRNSEARMPAFF